MNLRLVTDQRPAQPGSAAKALAAQSALYTITHRDGYRFAGG
ncbi:MAG: hypothetical protein ACREXN_07095 [Polaromonas sp.]